MGGVFRLMEGGTAKAHVNPDFEVLPENYYDPQQMRCVKDFLQVVYGIWKDQETTYNLTPNLLGFKFYEFSGPLVCLTCLWTGDPSEDGETLNLRGSGEHTHFWRETLDGGFDRAAGGHYHGDTTPDEVWNIVCMLKYRKPKHIQLVPQRWGTRDISAWQLRSFVFGTPLSKRTRMSRKMELTIKYQFGFWKIEMEIATKRRQLYCQQNYANTCNEPFIMRLTNCLWYLLWIYHDYATHPTPSSRSAGFPSIWNSSKNNFQPY